MHQNLFRFRFYIMILADEDGRFSFYYLSLVSQ